MPAGQKVHTLSPPDITLRGYSTISFREQSFMVTKVLSGAVETLVWLASSYDGPCRTCYLMCSDIQLPRPPLACPVLVLARGLAPTFVH